jgi:hypothetical protein
MEKGLGWINKFLSCLHVSTIYSLYKVIKRVAIGEEEEALEVIKHIKYIYKDK